MINPFRYLMRSLTLIVFNIIHTRKSIKRISILGVNFDVFPNVYNPVYTKSLEFPTTRHMAENICVQPCEKVLDMGTGIGVLAIIAALQGADVIATDILPEAIECASHNIKLNRVEKKVTVLQGDLFSSIDNEKFNLILWLAPSFFKDPKYAFQQGWMCGKGGDVLRRFCCDVDKYLESDGRILFSCVDRNRVFILSHLKSVGFNCRMVEPPKRRFPLETITIYEATRI